MAVLGPFKNFSVSLKRKKKIIKSFFVRPHVVYKSVSPISHKCPRRLKKSQKIFFSKFLYVFFSVFLGFLGQKGGLRGSKFFWDLEKCYRYGKTEGCLQKTYNGTLKPPKKIIKNFFFFGH